MFETRYRIQTTGTVSTQPVYRLPDPSVVGATGTIFFVSENGEVRAVQERSGDTLWRFTTGEPTMQPAVLVGDRIYVANQFGGLHCLDAGLGSEIWFSPGITQFVAASRERLYTIDVLGNLQILHAATGMRLASFSVVDLPLRVVNSSSDRVYLATETGLVQCLREIEQTQPLMHNRVIGREAAVPPAEEPGVQPVGPPAARPAAPAAETEDPFGGAEQDPIGGGAAPDMGEDPFR